MLSVQSVHVECTECTCVSCMYVCPVYVCVNEDVTRTESELKIS